MRDAASVLIMSLDLGTSPEYQKTTVPESMTCARAA